MTVKKNLSVAKLAPTVHETETRAGGYADWAMFPGWTMDASPRIYSTASLPLGARRRGCPLLRFNDICKRDIKACNIDTKSWEALVDNRNLWKQ